MIEAVVFDLDGLMIDSQPFWQTAQLEILPQFGVPITRQDTIDTTGMRIDHIVQMFYAKSPWDSVSCDEVCNQILNRVTELVQEHKPAMPGLNHAIEVCKRQGLKLAIASSSPMRLIDAAIAALRLDGVFTVTSSGEHLRYGKPHPEVYLNACHALKVEPQECVAIEDSFVGLLAAKAAQMKTIVVPEPSMANQKHFVIADMQLRSLEELTREILQSLCTASDAGFQRLGFAADLDVRQLALAVSPCGDTFPSPRRQQRPRNASFSLKLVGTRLAIVKVCQKEQLS